MTGHYAVMSTVHIKPMTQNVTTFPRLTRGSAIAEGPRDAMLSAVHAVVVYLSVRPSVCVSVTLRYCVKTAKCRMTQIMAHDRDIL